VLVVDEAHHLSMDVLEEVRLLTNLETPQQKLLQILLVGQQELEEKLDSPELRQLKQRIVMRSHLGALDLDETCGYIYRRMELSGCANPSQIFPIDTIVEVHRQSRGYPRLINILCENALIHGYGQQMACIRPAVIEEIAIDFRMDRETETSRADKKERANTLLD
jgi:general secretion pathway protein A